jgi:hypothetical protein
LTGAAKGIVTARRRAAKRRSGGRKKMTWMAIIADF